MTVSISDKQCTDLVEKILDFTKPGKWHTLRDFQSLAGHVNWSFAVFPLLKPSLSAMYEKMLGKVLLSAPICINKAVCEELLWFVNHARTSNGIFLLETVAWDLTMELSNTSLCYADACMGAWPFSTLSSN
jgi:hypothetical protein